MMADDFGMGYALGSDSNNRNDGGMFGGEGIWAIVLIALIFGGGRGFGGFGSAGGGCDVAGGALTRADLCNGFNFNDLQRGVSGIQQGICDSTYALNSSLMNGFHGVDNAICNLGYQMQSCCCDTNRNIDNSRYEMAKGFCDVIQNAHNDADRIIGVLTQDKIESLRTELQSAQLQLSNAAQTNAIVNELRPCPTPAYITCNPWGNTYGFGSGIPAGYSNSGCGGCCN